MTELNLTQIASIRINQEKATATILPFDEYKRPYDIPINVFSFVKWLRFHNFKVSGGWLYLNQAKTINKPTQNRQQMIDKQKRLNAKAAQAAANEPTPWYLKADPINLKTNWNRNFNNPNRHG